jgi:hypothetical protein
MRVRFEDIWFLAATATLRALYWEGACRALYMSRVTDRMTKSVIILQQLRLCIAKAKLDEAAVSIIYLLQQSATPRHRQCSGERA